MVGLSTSMLKFSEWTSINRCKNRGFRRFRPIRFEPEKRRAHYIPSWNGGIRSQKCEGPNWSGWGKIPKSGVNLSWLILETYPTCELTHWHLDDWIWVQKANSGLCWSWLGLSKARKRVNAKFDGLCSWWEGMSAASWCVMNKGTKVKRSSGCGARFR